MNKEKFGVAFLLIGVLILVGAGCGNASLTDTQKPTNIKPPIDNLNVNPDTIATESPDKFYNSTKEISAPNALASELKIILSEACTGAKLTTYFHDMPAPGSDELVYVWRDKPTEEKLTSVFEKNGYKIEFSGGIGLAEKGDTTLSVDWYYQLAEHEIVVLVATGE